MNPSQKTRFVMHSWIILDPTTEERWLEHMARTGWHMQSANFLGYTFRPGLPADISYRIDFRLVNGRQEKDYLDLFRDSGWEPIFGTGLFYYFRKPVQGGAVPEIYTDRRSLIAMYRRLSLFCAVFLAFILFSLFDASQSSQLLSSTYLHWVALGVQGISALGLTWSIARLCRVIRKLRKINLAAA